MAVPFRRESEETDRLPALSDGVIAIAITLLVLDITVPAIPEGVPVSSLPNHVFEQWHEFLGFVLSFLVIGMYWILHRRIFVHFEKHDRGVLWLNLLFLLMVAFVPFATSMFTTYPNQFGVMVYSGVLALTGFTLFVLWLYASWKNLVEEGLASRTVRIQSARFLSSPLVFVLSIVVAVFDFELAILTWLLLIPVNALLQSRLVRSVEESLQDSESGAR
ncbi:TMEM175 family protein [Halorussus halophilus]|uniref:TMEM175 family protein n=1 Tax=Halorussus halophilus TaxID=2650975 RepID=UPI0013015AB5|nr:TMEM175 family protein [Halorussus halophilus]